MMGSFTVSVIYTSVESGGMIGFRERREMRIPGALTMCGFIESLESGSRRVFWRAISAVIPFD